MSGPGAPPGGAPARSGTGPGFSGACATACPRGRGRPPPEPRSGSGARVAGTKAPTVGDPLDEDTELGPIATESGRRELAELVDEAVAKGAVLRCGGSAVGTRGWFFEPAVLEDVTSDMRVYGQEAFGPLAVVHRVDDIEQAVALANDTTFGLSSSVWTTDPEEERFLIPRLEAGAVFVNGMSVSYPELPFGGVKDSGIGRELAAEGIREFCNLKAVWKG
ncbi:aldehyde dehydrogenase family protein [Actinacidiphila glaucinigra]|nr:aldehyde dehydrogenase family protein [Actinacidiphila glaucinigra]